MSTDIATTSGSFAGADVDGLDKLAQEFSSAAQICNEVKAACEVIVAVASIFGPFGAAFVAYLKGTVIPWLTKIGEALTAMSKVLSIHSTAQKDASSASTSLPSYTSPTNLPTTSTQNYPTMPVSTAPSTGAGAGSAAPVTGGSSSVATPPSIGSSTTAGTSATTPAATGAGTGTGTPTVQAITAITGLVTAIDHLIHPGSSTTAAPVTGTPLPGTVDGTTATGTTGTTGAGDLGSSLGSVPSIGSGGTLGSGAIDISTLKPLHPGDSVGVVSMPVDISPTGKITPLLPTATPTPVVPTVHAATPLTVGHTTPSATYTADHSGSGGGSGGGFGGGGTSGGGGGSVPSVPVAHPTIAPTAAHVVAAHPAAHAAAAHPGSDAGPLTSASGPGASHDGLYSGLGQATGLGAGGAALARATLHEAKQRAEGALLGAHALPFDAGADGAAQSSVFAGELR